MKLIRDPSTNSKIQLSRNYCKTEVINTIFVKRAPEETEENILVQEREEPNRAMNPRWVFTDPDDFFGQDFYHDLLMEQQEQG